MVDLVRFEMGLFVYSGTSRLPLISPLIIIVRDFSEHTRGESPLQSSEMLSEQIFGLRIPKKKTLTVSCTPLCIVQ